MKEKLNNKEIHLFYCKKFKRNYNFEGNNFLCASQEKFKKGEIFMETFFGEFFGEFSISGKKI